MNSKFKRLLACLLSLMMVVSIFPMSAITAFADEADEADEIATVSESTIIDGGTWGGIDWTLTEDGTFTVAPTTGTPDISPRTKDPYAIGVWRENVKYNSSGTATEAGGQTNFEKYRSQVKKLVIEEGVTHIGAWVAKDFTNLEGEVVIPSTVNYIGQEAFQKSTMTKLIFAEGGTEELCIAQGAFKNLVLEEIILPADRPAVHLHAWMFLNSTDLEHVSFPANLTSVQGTHHHDWQNNPNGLNSGNLGTSVIIDKTNSGLEVLSFGNEDVYKLFAEKNTDNNYIKNTWLPSSAVVVTHSDGSLSYCKTLEAAAKYAKSGDTITLLKSTDEAVEIPAGVTLDLNGCTAPNVTVKAPSVAMIGEQSYETLADAIAAANAGDTITLLADVNENVTINKAITINGNGKTLSGTVSLATPNSGTTTFKNVVFKTANTNCFKTSGTAYNVTFDACTFNGAASYTFEIPSGSSANNFKFINECEVNMTSSLMQVSGSASDMLVDGMHIINCSNAFKVNKCGNAITFNNVTVDNAYIFIYGMGYSDMSFVINNCDITASFPFIRQDKAAMTYTYTFTGKNVVVAKNDDPSAPVAPTGYEGLFMVGTANSGAKLIWNAGLKGSGTETDPYQIGSLEDLIKFRNSVNAGETKYNAKGVYVVLTADIDLAGINWEPIGSPTAAHGFMGNFDGDGFKIKNLTINNPALDSDGYAYAGFFGITEGVDKNNQNTIKNLLIENVTISTTGHIVAGAIAYPYYTILDNITVCGNIAIEGGDYTAGVLAYTRRCTTASNITISGNAGSYITGAKTVGGVISDIQMNGGLTANYSNFSASGLTITGDMHVGGISGIICNQTLNGATVKNVKLVCSDARVGVVAGSLGGTATIKNVETSKVTGTKNIVGADFSTGKAVANKDDKYGIATAWINKVGYFLSLADAVEYVNDANKTSCTYIELLRDSEGSGFVVKAAVEIKFNGYTYTITKGVGSTGTESNGIQQLSGKLVLRNGTLKVADSIASTMYILVQSYDDLTVTGMTLDGTNLDKWSKHEDQVVNGDSYVVSKNNGEFVINTSNIITNDDGSKVFAFDLCDQRAYGYMDLPYASVATTTTINGVPVKESLDKVEAVANYSIYYYATLEQAIAKHPSAALIGDVVLKDTVVVPEGKTFTLDLNGHTITMKTAEYKSAIENNGTLTIKDSGENGGIAMIFTGTPSTAKAVNAISNRGKLTVQGGNISNSGNGNQIGYAIDNYNGATLTVKGGNITASGSTYYDAIRLFCGSKETKVTVSGGYISSIWAQNPSANKATEVNGSVVVTGGEIGTIYYENYTTVTITTKIAGNYNVVAYGANSENATSAKVAKNTVYSFAN